MIHVHVDTCVSLIHIQPTFVVAAIAYVGMIFCLARPTCFSSSKSIPQSYRFASMASNQLWSSIAKDTKSNYSGQRTFVTDDQDKRTNSGPKNSEKPRQKRSASPAHKPKTNNDEETVYVLTLLTDTAHHKRMTALRARYFPRKINKLDAHLTLFHALPESKLEPTVIPTIKRVAAFTQSFGVHAAKPFRMKKGISISVPKHQGGEKAQAVHGELLRAWQGEGWLSEQDAGGMRVHYTIMNKVDDDEAVEKVMDEVAGSWKGDWGRAVGLGLWRYEKGFWKWVKGYEFVESEGREK